MTAGIGNYVWNDLDANGIQDAGEPGLPGVAVTLYTCSSTLVAHAVTCSTGFYHFSDLVPGCYKVIFAVPGGMLVSPAKQGGNDTLDSDVDTGGASGDYSLVAGILLDTVDAGFIGATSGQRVVVKSEI